MELAVALRVQQAEPVQAAKSVRLVFAETISAFRRAKDVAANPGAIVVVRQMMNDGVTQPLNEERLLAKRANTALSFGEFAFDLEVRTDMPDELTPAHRIRVLWGDDHLSVPAEQVPVQNRRHV
jgi:hypothetical protein